MNHYSLHMCKLLHQVIFIKKNEAPNFRDLTVTIFYNNILLPDPDLRIKIKPEIEVAIVHCLYQISLIVVTNIDIYLKNETEFSFA